MKTSDIRKEMTDIYGVSDVLRLAEPAISPVPPVQKSTQPQESWDSIKKALTDCKRCRLSAERNHIVFGEGSQTADLMFIGEGPGADEDRTGRPFVGKAGQLLTKMIKAMGYEREEVFIANVVKCRPPGNRKPVNDEVEACIGFLETQIRLINPKVIVCLGDVAATHILQSGIRISRLRGHFQDYNGIRVMPTFHPAYLLRNESAKRDVWNDLKLVMAELGKK